MVWGKLKLKKATSTKKVPKKVPQYRGTSTSDLFGSRRVHRHPYCRGFKLKKASSTVKYRKKYRNSTAVGPAGPGGPGESIDTHIVGSLSSKSRKNEKSGFSKNRISRSGSGLGDTGTSGGWPWGPKGSLEAKKKKFRIFEKSGFTGSGPDFRTSSGPCLGTSARPTWSQNFSFLAALEEVGGSWHYDYYYLDTSKLLCLFQVKLTRLGSSWTSQ